jgi:short-subunit dehydrogenase
MAKKGLNVVLVSRTKSKLDNLASELRRKYGISTKIIVADFMDPNVLHRIVQELDQFNIDIGVLVNNVGMLGEHHMPFLELDLETVTGMINVNILAGTVLCHALVPKMKKKGRGAVINISSSANFTPIPHLAVYAATKHYMTAFTMAIAEEYKGCGREIQCIEPGAVKTSMTELFDEAPSFVFPPLEVYTKSACQTLGFTKRTCGYIGHAIQMGVGLTLLT